MTGNTAYRLGNYRITCSENTLYWWETHLALGVQRHGRCFVHKNLLIIGHSSSDEDGCLIGEFLEELQQLPPWDMTPYYCFAHELFHVATGKSPANTALDEQLRNPVKKAPDLGAVPGTFRLGQYRLTVTAAGGISWQSYGAGGHLTAGPCFIESDLLCVGGRQTVVKSRGIQEFLAKLDGLPMWDQTFFWCRDSVLRPCRPQYEKEKKAAFPWQFGRRDEGSSARPVAAPRRHEVKSDHPRPEKPEPFSRIGHGERVQQFFQAWRDRLQVIRPHISFEKIRPKYWITLVAAGLLFGVTMLLMHAFENGVPWPHWFTKHHHEHNDHEHHKEHKR